MEHASEQQVRLGGHDSPERRAYARVPLTVELRYSVQGGRPLAKSGSGRTTDLSSSGLGFTADRRLLIGQTVTVSIEWPVPLDRGLQLQLIMAGVVVRTSGRATALQIQRHDFRTRRMSRKASRGEPQ